MKLNNSIEKQSHKWSDEWIVSNFKKVLLSQKAWFETMRRGSFRDPVSRLLYDNYYEQAVTHWAKSNPGKPLLLSEFAKHLSRDALYDWKQCIYSSFLISFGNSKSQFLNWVEISEGDFSSISNQPPISFMKYALIKYYGTSEKIVSKKRAVRSEFEKLISASKIVSTKSDNLCQETSDESPVIPSNS